MDLAFTRVAVIYALCRYGPAGLRGRRWMVAIQRFLGGARLFTEKDYQRMKKLNLGSSDRLLPGWVNVDVHDLPGLDYVIDIRDLHVFGDESFDLVRASHVLEHFYVDELEEILAEWNRVLKVGGWMMISVPNFDTLILRYRRDPGSFDFTRDGFDVAILDQIYGHGFEHPNDDYYKHTMVYNEKSLRAVLEKIGGLSGIRVFNFVFEQPLTLGIRDDSTNIYSLNVAGQKTSPLRWRDYRPA